MGYIDAKLYLSTNQAIAGGTDAISENTLDTELTYPGWEKGQPAAVVVQCEVTGTGTTGFNFIVVNHTAAPTDGTYEIARMKVAIGSVVKGAKFIIPLPAGVDLKRHLALYFDCVNNDETGTFTAFVLPMPN
ncbi:MAG: hypothetical protein M0R74_15290 [Dehalococcoidia bacterium]|nr:hypothetical protein [Dehalococcoidia bacterium]